MINVGDKLTCSNNYADLFFVGHEYEVLNIIYDTDIDDYKIFLKPDFYSGHYWFILNNNKHRFYFGNYFRNIKIDRVNKLKKLKKISNNS